MRVLYLTNIPSPYRVDFFNELGRHVNLTVVFEREYASDRDKKWTGNRAETYKEVYLKGKNTRADAAICPSIARWLDKNKYDIFIIGGYSTPTAMIAIMILNLKKIPFILNTDGGFIKQDNKLRYLVKKYFISSANWWLSTGLNTNKYLEHYGAKEENIFIYPFTSIRREDIIESRLDYRQKYQLRQKLNIKGKKVLLSVGQLIHRKGYDLLIEVCKSLNSQWEVVIIGSGPDKDYLNELIIDNKLTNIKIKDFLQKQELKEYYLASDLFILPTREDIWGLVINEAMACGLGIISTNKCISAMELIESKDNGFIIDIDEVYKCGDLINKISYEDMNKMGVSNIIKIKNYTIEEMVNEHVKIFRYILE